MPGSADPSVGELFMFYSAESRESSSSTSSSSDSESSDEEVNYKRSIKSSVAVRKKSSSKGSPR